ncbi:MAG: LAGLIDADG family homing endonuclease, partial [Vulcanisaeta sp.]
HELWLRSDYKTRCEILSLLRDLGVSRRWLGDASGSGGKIGNWLKKCGIEIERHTTKSKIIEEIEDLMKRGLGWTEEAMCRNLLQFIEIDVNEFERHGIDVCGWLRAGTSISYLVGLVASDIADRVVKARNNEYVKVSLKTTEAISAVIFPRILSNIGRPGVTFVWDNGTPRQRKRTGIVAVEYYVYVRKEEWKWLSIEELIKYIKTLGPEDIPKLAAGAIDGDGIICIRGLAPCVEITACRNCEKRALLEAIQEALRKLGIKSRIYEDEKYNIAVLRVCGKNAIKLLRLIMPYLHYPIKYLRARLILMFYDGEIDRETFTTLYGLTEYGDDDNDPKRHHGLEALAQAAPQTHTHGEQSTNT